MFYCLFVLSFCLYMIYKVAPVHGNRNPIVYISICSLVGSISVMAVKGFGLAIKLTLAGNNQLWRVGTWVFGFVVVGCIVVQMNYFNKVCSFSEKFQIGKLIIVAGFGFIFNKCSQSNLLRLFFRFDHCSFFDPLPRIEYYRSIQYYFLIMWFLHYCTGSLSAQVCLFFNGVKR